MSKTLLTSNAASAESGTVRKARKAKNQVSKKAKPSRESDPLALYFRQISKFPLLTMHE